MTGICLLIGTSAIGVIRANVVASNFDQLDFTDCLCKRNGSVPTDQRKRVDQ
nr:hypothetical protein [Enterococcus durans]